MHTEPYRYHAVVSDLHFGDGSALDDFVYGLDFQQFLEHVHRQGVMLGGRAELIVNGDFLDFLQVSPLRHGPWREAIGKLSFRDVQEAFKGLVNSDRVEGSGEIVFPNGANLGAHFRGWKRGPFVYRLPGVYIEHGNQFDALNLFDHRDFYTDAAKQHIRLPWGSHFVLDLFNEVEAESACERRNGQLPPLLEYATSPETICPL